MDLTLTISSSTALRFFVCNEDSTESRPAIHARIKGKAKIGVIAFGVIAFHSSKQRRLLERLAF